MGSRAEADHNFSEAFEGDEEGEGVDLVGDVLIIHVFGVAWGGVEVGSAQDVEGVLSAANKKAEFTYPSVPRCWRYLRMSALVELSCLSGGSPGLESSGMMRCAST